MPIQRGKTICFIDNSNIFKGQQDLGWRIDWSKFQTKIEEDGSIWQTYFFASENDPPRAIQSTFYRFLKEQLRWEVFLYDLGKKTIKCNQCGHSEVVPTEKGADVGLATKMLILGSNKAYETAILVSGDRDYLETIKFIKNIGLRTEIMGWRTSMSSELAAESSSIVKYLDDLKGEIEKV
ncbi:NYN domain-containing protein [Candidatus Poribacteria bacterium]|nr:NYN domain-containing protein [Candidatus Poribacteria bacterium]